MEKISFYLCKLVLKQIERDLGSFITIILEDAFTHVMAIKEEDWESSSILNHAFLFLLF